jgi:hypothetical protein
MLIEIWFEKNQDFGLISYSRRAIGYLKLNVIYSHTVAHSNTAVVRFYNEDGVIISFLPTGSYLYQNTQQHILEN